MSEDATVIKPVHRGNWIKRLIRGLRRVRFRPRLLLMIFSRKGFFMRTIIATVLFFFVAPTLDAAEKLSDKFALPTFKLPMVQKGLLQKGKTAPVGDVGKKVEVDKERLIKTVHFLSEEVFPRTANAENKEKTIDYISTAFARAGLDATRDDQRIEIGLRDRLFTNIHALKKGKTDRRIVVAAHYDTVPQSPGADDNASGVAVLIELAHLLKNAELNCDIEFVSYDAEETGFLGSWHHAGTLKKQKIDVVCMLCLDLVGYYSDEENSQKFPIPGMNLIYGNKGDFLGMTGRLQDARLIADAKKVFRKTSTLRIESIAAPKDLEGPLSLSDHRSFWNEGFSALFFTDTAFYRNMNYHKETDTWDTLDYDRMVQVAVGLYHVILMIDGR